MSVIFLNCILNIVGSFAKSILNAYYEPGTFLATEDPGEMKSQSSWDLNSSGLEMANNINMYTYYQVVMKARKKSKIYPGPAE